MTKYAGRGITVELNNTEVAQLLQVGEVGSKRGLIDASVYGDDWKDWLTGQQDGDEVTLVIAYDPALAGHDAIRTAYDGDPDTVHEIEIIHADAGMALTVSCRLTGMSRGGALDGLLQMTLTIKIVEPGVVGS